MLANIGYQIKAQAPVIYFLLKAGINGVVLVSFKRK